MDDSDETVCDDVDDPTISSQSPMSPSIIAAIPRFNRSEDLDKKAPAECESKITGDVHGSPEYLPPSAKIKRLASKETPSLDEGCSKSSDCNELLNSQATSKEMTAAEKLTLIREKEEKIEEMLVLLESSVERGKAPKEKPIFVQVKHLMTTVKSQLADFTHYQQQQRKEIASSGNGEPGSQDGCSSQWTSQTKHKLLELAAQQKELLTLFQRHKKLLEKIQALKQKARSTTKHIIPAVEVHCKSKRGGNVQQETPKKNTEPSLLNSSSTCTSNMNPLAVATCLNTIPNITTKQGYELSVSKHTSIPRMSVPSVHTENSYRAIASQPLVTSAVTQVITSHTPVTVFHSVSSASLTTPSVIPQPRVQNAVLTAAQLYQVGGRQIYVLPQGLPVTTTYAVTQTAQPQLVTAKLPSTTYTASAMPEMGLIPSLSVTKSAQGYPLNTVVSLPSTAASWLGQISQSSSQVSSIVTAVPGPSSTLLNLDNPSHSNVSLPVSTRTVNNSLALQNAPPPIGCDGGSHVIKQGLHSNHKAPISCAASESAQTVPQLHKSARLQSQHSIPTQNAVGVQSSSQVAMTTEPVASKGAAVQSRTLQRRGSFGNDLPDVKTLLNHNVIQAGPNVLSMQYEGRNFEASLRSNGLIESAGGETFRTPMAWMKAVTGSWNNVKQSQAYKMVCYKGRPLALFTIPSTNAETCENRGKDNVSNATRGRQEGAGSNVPPCSDGQDKTNKEGGLLTCWEDVAQLLTDCKVIPIGKDELIPTDSFLPANFWDSTNEVDIPASLLEEVEF